MFDLVIRSYVFNRKDLNFRKTYVKNKPIDFILSYSDKARYEKLN
jgi:hypothetical protein